MDEIRRMHRISNESDLSLVIKVKFAFETAKKKSDDRECVLVFFAKIFVALQDKIVERLDFDTMGLSELMEFLKARDTQVEYKRLAKMR